MDGRGLMMYRMNGSERGMNEDSRFTGERRGSNHVREAWHFLRRNAWLVLSAPLVVLAVAAVALQVIRPVYETAATLRIDEERSSVPVLDALRSLSSGSEVNTEMQVLRSRTLAEAVLDSLRLQVELRTPKNLERGRVAAVGPVARDAPRRRYDLRRMDGDEFELRARRGGQPVRLSIGEPVRLDGFSVTLRPGALEHDRIVLRVSRYDDALRDFRRTLAVSRPVRDADIVELRFSGTDRALATAVPNVLADRFIALRAAERGAESRSTIEFLDEQLELVRGELTLAENNLQRFREDEGVISLEAEARANVTGLGDMKAQRDMLAAEADAFEALLRRVAAMDPAADPYAPRALLAFPSLFRVPAASTLLTSLSEAEGQRARLLERLQPDEPEVARLTQRIRELEAQITAITRSYLSGLREQVVSMDRSLARFRTDLQSVPEREVTYARLVRETRGLDEIYALLQMRLKEQEVVAAVHDNSVRVVDPSVPPRRPAFPNVPLTLVLSLMVGAVLGVGAAFFRDQMDTAVHTREDLASATAGASVLAVIPRIRAIEGNGRVPGVPGRPLQVEAAMLVGAEPSHVAAEAYRALRTSIAFSRPGSPPRVLVMTSPTPGDGKSTSSGNLALVLAQQGHRTLLVDADLRRGALHDALGGVREPGLSNLLLGRVKIEEAVQSLDVRGVALDLIPTGVIPPNPAELLGSEAMRGLLGQLSETYDYVVVDAPPLNLVTDSALLGTMADGVVLIARAGVTDREALEFAAERLRAVRAPLLGTVLNDAGQGRERYYGSYSPELEEYVKV
jgi:capsular exopolysaccharide synthesis family protein